MDSYDFAAKAIILKNDQFLALKRTDEEGDIWEIPGGRMEYGETLEQTLIREVKEETDLTVNPERIINSWDLIEDSRQISGVIYLCKKMSGKIKLSDEHKDYTWLNMGDLHKLYPVFANRLIGINLL